VIDRRLLALAPEAGRRVAGAVLAKWGALLADVTIIAAVTRLLGLLAAGGAPEGLAATLAVCALAALLRAFCGLQAEKVSFAAQTGVKKQLREKLYAHLTKLGPGYGESIGTAEILQIATEGVDQLEIYFGRYLPQFFYSIAAPLTLFCVMAPIDLRAAAVLLVCAPLIPAILLLIGRMAGKMAGRQWESYISLGDRFLENIQGMTTLKVYGADGGRQEDMAGEAESFRRSTMRLLRMQLSTLILMDVVAFGGAALGAAAAALAYEAGRVSLAAALTLALLAAEYFIPLRQLGSYFHVAMNGVSAGERMFQFLSREAPPDGTDAPPAGRLAIEVKGLSFRYPGGERDALAGVESSVPVGALTALAGPAGCGKSTAAALLSGRQQGYTGSAAVGGRELSHIAREELRRRVTLVSHDSYVFTGTAADNLRLARPEATEAEMIEALRAVRLWDFFQNACGLATVLSERGANLSGGQRQRLCIARALLKDSDVYIFDEATSNIDAESEEAIMSVARRLAATRTVLIISHRLANLTACARIYLLADGRVAERGTHAELLARDGVYAKLYNEQLLLENYGKRGVHP
jgi:ABC-type transport system involved in cytochrome bd biosynthesis fused ATPase/permease subunit